MYRCSLFVRNQSAGRSHGTKVLRDSVVNGQLRFVALSCMYPVLLLLVVAFLPYEVRNYYVTSAEPQSKEFILNSERSSDTASKGETALKSIDTGQAAHKAGSQWGFFGRRAAARSNTVSWPDKA